MQEPPEVFPEDKKGTSVLSGTTNNGAQLHVTHLDWLNYSKDKLPMADVVVGSDLVYAEELAPALGDVLRDLLVPSSSPGAKEAFIACTHRGSGHNLNLFLSGLKIRGLSAEVFMKRTFSPGESALSLREAPRPITLYRIFST